MEKYLITGGAGFIGSSLVRNLVSREDCNVLNIDKLTYAGNLDNLRLVESSNNYQFQQMDIANKQHLEKTIMEYQPDYIMHLAI